jgi:GxxExxY protein
VADNGGDPRSYAIIGAAMEVHRVLGCGFLESVHHHALAAEFGLRELPFQREVPVVLHYKGVLLPTAFRADFLCYDDVIVELKAQNKLIGTDEAQLLNYLKASNKNVGLLLNFGTIRLEYRRFVGPQHSQNTFERSF